jgi:hypothetical protein
MGSPSAVPTSLPMMVSALAVQADKANSAATKKSVRDFAHPC